MVAKEAVPESVPENINLGFQDCDEAAETLSLCDLPLNTCASADWDEFSREAQSSSSDAGDEDFFEFFSEDFTAPTCNSHLPDNIVFCGKLIPHKGTEIKPQNMATSKSNAKRKGKINFPWKLNASDKSRTSLPRKPTDKYDLDSMKRISILSTPSKSRWYLLAFGAGRIPMEMELSDIKTRQSKISAGKMFRTDDRTEIVKSATNGKRAKSLWGLLKVLGCKSSYRATTIVKASFGCIPSARGLTR